MARGEGGGRPRFEFTDAIYNQIKALGQIHCTIEEIAVVIGCSHDTLTRNPKFNELYSEAIMSGKASLRRLQWKKAAEGDRTMLIWLGKQMLGQRDKTDQLMQVSGEVTTTAKETPMAGFTTAELQKLVNNIDKLANSGKGASADDGSQGA